MGRWAQHRRRGTSDALPSTPQIVSATVDPGAFGATDGLLTITFDRPMTTIDASELVASLVGVGFFEFNNGPSTFVPGTLSASWTSTSWTVDVGAETNLSWGGTDGPMVAVDGSTLNAIDTDDVSWL